MIWLIIVSLQNIRKLFNLFFPSGTIRYHTERGRLVIFRVKMYDIIIVIHSFHIPLLFSEDYTDSSPSAINPGNTLISR